MSLSRLGVLPIDGESSSLFNPLPGTAQRGWPGFPTRARLGPGPFELLQRLVAAHARTFAETGFEPRQNRQRRRDDGAQNAGEPAGDQRVGDHFHLRITQGATQLDRRLPRQQAKVFGVGVECQFQPLGGQVDLAVSTITPALPHIAAGKLRPLGVSSASRSSALPDVPSIAEQGMPGFDEKPGNCFVTTAGVPAPVLERLRAAYKAAIEDPEVAGALRKAGIEEVGAWSPAKIAEQMQADHQKWGVIIRKANIRMEG